MRQKMTDKRTFCIEEQTGETIDDIAQRVGTSPSEVIRECITKYFPKLRSEVEKQVKTEVMKQHAARQEQAHETN